MARWGSQRPVRELRVWSLGEGHGYATRRRDDDSGGVSRQDTLAGEGGGASRVWSPRRRDGQDSTNQGSSATTATTSTATTTDGDGQDTTGQAANAGAQSLLVGQKNCTTTVTSQGQDGESSGGDEGDGEEEGDEVGDGEGNGNGNGNGNGQGTSRPASPLQPPPPPPPRSRGNPSQPALPLPALPLPALPQPALPQPQPQPQPHPLPQPVPQPQVTTTATTSTTAGGNAQITPSPGTAGQDPPNSGPAGTVENPNRGQQQTFVSSLPMATPVPPNGGGPPLPPLPPLLGASTTVSSPAARATVGQPIPPIPAIPPMMTIPGSGCGNPTSTCTTTTAVAPVATGYGLPTTFPGTSNPAVGGQRSRGQTAGIAIGSLAAFALVIGIIFYAFRKVKRRKAPDFGMMPEKSAGGRDGAESRQQLSLRSGYDSNIWSVAGTPEPKPFVYSTGPGVFKKGSETAAWPFPSETLMGTSPSGREEAPSRALHSRMSGPLNSHPVSLEDGEDEDDGRSSLRSMSTMSFAMAASVRALSDVVGHHPTPPPSLAPPWASASTAATSSSESFMWPPPEVTTPLYHPSQRFGRVAAVRTVPGASSATTSGSGSGRRVPRGQRSRTPS